MTTSFRFPQAVGVDTSGLRRVAVIGAGSMGGGIAAQFANAGVPVDLLDVPGVVPASRSAPAEAGVARQLKAGGFMSRDAALLVRAGNIEDDFARLAEADWIVEVIVEKLEAKRDLYRRLATVRKKGSLVSSNTSTILRGALMDGMPEDFAADFLITHFFNPPRVMQLVEIIGSPQNPPERIAAAGLFCEAVLGKTAIDCKDTPGFIANRIGCYALAVGALEAIRQGITVEEADAVLMALGAPRTGVFGVLDLIGLDLIPHVWGSLMNALPESDDLQRFDLPGNAVVGRLLAAGRFGRKSGAGFYRMMPDKTRQAIDLGTGEYRPVRAVEPGQLAGGGKNLEALLDSDDRLGRFAWTIYANLVSYVSAIADDICYDRDDIDLAMMLGYGWSKGPLTLLQRYSGDKVAARFALEGRPLPSVVSLKDIPPRKDHAERGLTLAQLRQERKPILENEAASLWDLGNGIACFEMHTKLNSFAPAVFEVLEPSLARVETDFSGLVLGNDDARAFSAGADLRAFLGMIIQGDWAALNAYIARGQDLFLRMKYAPFPVVAAAHGLALGGGCEFMLNANAIVAHAELNAGLPETKVGIIPGWGGGTQLLLRAAQNDTAPHGPSANAQAVFDLIMQATVSTSALHARELGMLVPTDRIVMNRSHLLREARNLAVQLSLGYEVPPRATLTVTGRSGYLTLTNGVRAQHNLGKATETDIAIAEALALALTGGNSGSDVATEEGMMRLEREGGVELAKRPQTKARIEHMLNTGKPLRN